MKTLSQIVILALLLPPGAFAEKQKKEEEKECAVAGVDCSKAVTGSLLTVGGSTLYSTYAAKHAKTLEKTLGGYLAQGPKVILPESNVAHPVGQELYRKMDKIIQKNGTTEIIGEIDSGKLKKMALNDLMNQSISGPSKEAIKQFGKDQATKILNADLDTKAKLVRTSHTGALSRIKIIVNENPTAFRTNNALINSYRFQLNTVVPGAVTTIKVDGEAFPTLFYMMDDPALKARVHGMSYSDWGQKSRLSPNGQLLQKKAGFWKKAKSNSLKVAVAAAATAIVAALYQNSQNAEKNAKKPNDVPLAQFKDVSIVDDNHMEAKREVASSVPEVEQQTNEVIAAPDSANAQ